LTVIVSSVDLFYVLFAGLGLEWLVFVLVSREQVLALLVLTTRLAKHLVFSMCYESYCCF